MSWSDDTVSIPQYPSPLVDTEHLYGEDRDEQAVDGDGENPRLANSDVRFRDFPAKRDSDDENICTILGRTLRNHPDYIPIHSNKRTHVVGKPVIKIPTTLNWWRRM